MAVTLGEAILYLKADGTELKKALGRSLNDVEKATLHLSENTQKIGTAFTVAGAGITAALGVSVKSAIDFESAFAGVVKTVSASGEQLAALRDGFRQLAQEIPVSANELAHYGELAGQLGIQTDNILGFTRVIADLGVATNLAGEEAALTLAQFANITQMDQTQFSNLGSAIVALGNNLATTEADIVSMASRLAGAGATIELSEAEILGFAAALSSVGIEAEAGGSAFSKVMIDIASSVAAGVDESNTQLFRLAEVAGVSMEEFVKAFGDSPVEAIIMFVEGLARLKDEGEDVFTVLGQMKMGEIRMRDALLRSASATGLMTEAIKISSGAFEENIALQTEAAARYSTTESQLAMLKNTIVDMAITVGEALLPPMTALLEKIKPIVTDIAAWAKSNPELTQAIVLAAGAIGGLLITLGPLLVMLPGIVTAFGLMGSAVTVVGGVLAAIAAGPFAVIGIAILAVVTAIAALAVKFESVRDVVKHVAKGIFDFFMFAVDTLVDSWKVSFEFLGQILSSPVDAFKAAWNGIVEWFGNIVNGIMYFLGWLWDGIKLVISALGELIGLTGQVSAPNTGGGAPGGVAGALADGGPVRAGARYLVGEEGPEVFQPNVSGRIIPNDKLSGAGGGPLVQVNQMVVREEADIHRISYELARMIQTGVPSYG